MIGHAAIELEKIAVNWTPLKARLAETAAGAGVGGVLGGMAGSSTYTPRAPVHRVDAQGYLMQRDLSKEEKKERLSRTLKASAGGAALGAGGSLATSKGLRHLMDMAEKDTVDAALQGMVQGRKGLPQRKEILEKLYRRRHLDLHEYHERPGSVPWRPGDDLPPGNPEPADIGRTVTLQERRAREARKMLDEEEQRILNLAEKARAHRSARPWGYLQKGLDGVQDPRGSFLSRLDAEEREGLVSMYNRMLQERARA